VAWISDRSPTTFSTLLGGAPAAPRPEARAAPSSQDQSITMAVHSVQRVAMIISGYTIMNRLLPRSSMVECWSESLSQNVEQLDVDAIVDLISRWMIMATR